MVIYILWLRQIKKYLRSRSRIIGSLGQPLLFLVALGFGFGPVYQKAGGGNYIQFITPGIIAMSILFLSVFSGIEMIWDRQFGFLKETFVAPVSRFKIVLGRTLGGASVAFLQGFIVLLIVSIFKFKVYSWWALLGAFGVMFLIALLFAAFGTVIGSLLEDMHAFQIIVNFLIMPMFFLSGALFPLQGLPKIMTIVAALDPLTYGVDALRYLLIGPSYAHFSLGLDLAVLSGTTLVLLGLASYFFNKIKM